MTPNQSNPDLTKQVQSPAPKGFFKRGKHWPFVIVGMLLFHASLMIGTIVYVAAKHDLYVDADYYAKSVDWDTQKQRLEAPNKAGWVVSVCVTQEDSTPESSVLRVTILDASGQPIEGALVEVECFHPAHANIRINKVLHATDDHAYQQRLAMNTKGFWQTNLTIRHQGTHAVVVREVEIQ